MPTVSHIRAILAAPGSRKSISNTAVTQIPHCITTDSSEKEQAQAAATSVEGFSPAKRRRLDRWLDWIVKASGSQPVFAMILISLLVWALAGIRFGQSYNWQVLISDIQAIFCYIYDSLLMRQQLNSYETQLRFGAGLRSRMISVKRMLRQIGREGGKTEIPLSTFSAMEDDTADDLPKGTLVTRASNTACQILGHFITCILYWVCIIIWIAFGPSQHWSDKWQLYINSATSALMILVFAFLANIRELHEDYSASCLVRISEVDTALEQHLRDATGDTIPNEPVLVHPRPVSRLQRAIFYYADVIGTLIGIALLMIVFAVWIAIGPALGFNSSWWLIIGTYAGLVGMQDGLVLHNIQEQLHAHEDEALADVNFEDAGAYDIIGLPLPAETEHTTAMSISSRISMKLGQVWAHVSTILVGIAMIVGFLVGATVLQWSLTGQLLCNVPPSIIETYIMMALITGHALSSDKRRAEMQDLYRRRVKLLKYVEAVVAEEKHHCESDAAVAVTIPA